MSVDGPALYRHARERIPGGTQLLSKRPERFLPDIWPSYFESAKGAEVTDLSGRTYVDMSLMGVGACVLGYADPDVDDAVRSAIEQGTNTTLNSPEEVELADELVRLHPWADLVRFARTGGEAMAIAIRIARAWTGLEEVAFCGYHGWHDWYLAANLSDDSALDGHLLPGLPPNGVPRALQGTAHPFGYNDIEGFETVISDHGSQLGAIVMEPIRSTAPEGEFLEVVRRAADDLRIPLIFDEVSSGFRISVGGAHKALGVEPDIAVFAKGLGNGYPTAAIIGREQPMAAARDCFISSTYWTERIGAVAGLATLHKFEERSVHDHLEAVGRRVQHGWETVAEEAGLNISVSGIPPLAHFHIDGPEPEAAHTLFTQLLLQDGYLATNLFYASYAHQVSDVEEYLGAVGDAFEVISRRIEEGTVTEALKGEPRETGFSRLT